MKTTYDRDEETTPLFGQKGDPLNLEEESAETRMEKWLERAIWAGIGGILMGAIILIWIIMEKA